MEFGLLPQPDGAPNSAPSGSETLLLIDELLTPDSRASGRPPPTRWARPPSYDKQYVRDYLEGSGWNKEPPAPALPPEVVAQTRQRYVDALRRLTGSDAL